MTLHEFQEKGYQGSLNRKGPLEKWPVCTRLEAEVSHLQLEVLS